MARVCRVVNLEDDPFPIGGVRLLAGELNAVLVQDETCLVRVTRKGLRVVPPSREVRMVEGEPVLLDTAHESYFENLQKSSKTLSYERQPDVPGPAEEVARQLLSLFELPA